MDSFYGTRHVSLTERSKLVTGLERIWHPQLLLSRRQLKITLDNPCVNYQACNGAIIVATLSPTGRSLHEIQVYRLPSYLTGLKSKLWKHKLATDANINQFKVDPGQDLLVLVGISAGAPGQYKHRQGRFYRCFDIHTNVDLVTILQLISTYVHCPGTRNTLLQH